MFTPITNPVIETTNSQDFSTVFNDRIERVQNDIGSFFARETNIDQSAYDELDLMNRFNWRDKISVSTRYDSLGRKTFPMPIVYDLLQKRLVKTLVQKEDVNTAHLDKKMWTHECTMVPRTANSTRHGDGPNDIHSRLKANLMEPLAKIERAPFTSRQDIDLAAKVAHSMVCYFHKEVKPINSKSLKEAQQEKAGKATVKVEVLSKEVNHILN